MKGQFTFMVISGSVILRIRNIWDKFCGENQNTHFKLIDNFLKSCRLWDNVEEYCRARQSTDDNTAHAHCMLYTNGYRHIIWICNNYCFAIATVIEIKRFNVTLYVYFMSSLFIKYLKKFRPNLKLTVTHCNMFNDYGEYLSAPLPTCKVTSHNFLSVHCLLINKFQSKWRINW